MDKQTEKNIQNSKECILHLLLSLFPSIILLFLSYYIINLHKRTLNYFLAPQFIFDLYLHSKLF